MLYARSWTVISDSTDTDLVDAIAVKPLADEVDSEEADSVELLTGIDDENVREAFRVCCEVTAP